MNKSKQDKSNFLINVPAYSCCVCQHLSHAHNLDTLRAKTKQGWISEWAWMTQEVKGPWSTSRCVSVQKQKAINLPPFAQHVQHYSVTFMSIIVSTGDSAAVESNSAQHHQKAWAGSGLLPNKVSLYFKGTLKNIQKVNPGGSKLIRSLHSAARSRSLDVKIDQKQRRHHTRLNCIMLMKEVNKETLFTVWQSFYSLLEIVFTSHNEGLFALD